MPDDLTDHGVSEIAALVVIGDGRNLVEELEAS
jgi:hypothetical protein